MKQVERIAYKAAANERIAEAARAFVEWQQKGQPGTPGTLYPFTYAQQDAWHDEWDKRLAALIAAVEAMPQESAFSGDSARVGKMTDDDTLEPGVVAGCHGDGHCEHTICAFCGQEIEAERKPRISHGWRCSECTHWQYERYCQLFKAWG